MHPAKILNTFEARINQARHELARVTQDIVLAREQAQSIRNAAAEARIRHETSPRTTPMTPEQFKRAAQAAYNAAIIAHPEDVIEGPRRLALLNHEARHLKAVS